MVVEKLRADELGSMDFAIETDRQDLVAGRMGGALLYLSAPYAVPKPLLSVCDSIAYFPAIGLVVTLDIRCRRLVAFSDTNWAVVWERDVHSRPLAICRLESSELLLLVSIDCMYCLSIEKQVFELSVLPGLVSSEQAQELVRLRLASIPKTNDFLIFLQTNSFQASSGVFRRCSVEKSFDSTHTTKILGNTDKTSPRWLDIAAVDEATAIIALEDSRSVSPFHMMLVDIRVTSALTSRNSFESRIIRQITLCWLRKDVVFGGDVFSQGLLCVSRLSASQRFFVTTQNHGWLIV